MQTGFLKITKNNQKGSQIVEPLMNTHLYFSQDGVRKVTTKTNAQGKYSFKLPVGSYQVSISTGADGNIFPLLGGRLFELKQDSSADAFEKWVEGAISQNLDQNPLLVRLQELSKIAADAAAEATRIAEQLKSQTKDYLKRGAYGLGDNNGRIVMLSNKTIPVSCFIQGDGSSTKYLWQHGRGINCVSEKGKLSTQFIGAGSEAAVINHDNNEIKRLFLYHTLNTTKDSNGNLKVASPIIRLFDTHIEHNGGFLEEPIFEKLGVGVYKISNTLGLAKEGWYIEVPKDRNGFPYFLIEWHEDGEKNITIKCFKKRFDQSKGEWINGEPVDIQENQRWIDVRCQQQKYKVIKDFPLMSEDN